MAEVIQDENEIEVREDEDYVEFSGGTISFYGYGYEIDTGGGFSLTEEQTKRFFEYMKSYYDKTTNDPIQ